jgi:hypothetical protein
MKAYRAAMLLRQQVDASFKRSPTAEWGSLLAAAEEIEEEARQYVQRVAEPSVGKVSYSQGRPDHQRVLH